MTALMKIQTFIQAYAQAISSILECDVTVVDNQLIRVAGTGNYAFEVGNTIAHAKFFHEILKSGKCGIITNAAEVVKSVLIARNWQIWHILFLKMR